MVHTQQQIHCVKEYSTHSTTTPLCKGVWYTFNNPSERFHCICVLFSFYMPRELNVVHFDCAGKLRQHTSTGNNQVCQPRSLHRVCRYVYVCVGFLHFICTPASFFPIYCQFHDDKALCSRSLNDNVLSEIPLDDVWKLQLLCPGLLEASSRLIAVIYPAS